MGRFLAEGFGSSAGCQSSLVSLGLMRSVSSAIFSRVSRVGQSYQNWSEGRAWVPAAPSPPAGKLFLSTGSKYFSLSSLIKLPLLCAQATADFSSPTAKHSGASTWKKALRSGAITSALEGCFEVLALARAFQFPPEQLWAGCVPLHSPPIILPMVCARQDVQALQGCQLCHRLNSLFRRDWGRHAEDNSPCHPGHEFSFHGPALKKWIFVLMHTQASVCLS